MATKKSNPKTDSKVTRWRTGLEYEEAQMSEYAGCCGIGIFEYLPDRPADEDSGYQATQSRKKWTADDPDEVEYELDDYPYTSLSAMVKGLYKQLEDERKHNHVQVSLVTKYKDKDESQFPEFYNYLVKTKKWKVLAKFINPNHGNEVTVLGKTWTGVPPKKESVGLFGRW